MQRRHWNKIAETAIVKDFNNCLLYTKVKPSYQPTNLIQNLNYHKNQYKLSLKQIGN